MPSPYTNVPSVIRRHRPPQNAQEGLIGSGLRASEWCQNARRTDPHPEIPFSGEITAPSTRIVLVCTVLAVALIAVAAWIR